MLLLPYLNKQNLTHVTITIKIIVKLFTKESIITTIKIKISTWKQVTHENLLKQKNTHTVAVKMQWTEFGFLRMRTQLFYIFLLKYSLKTVKIVKYAKIYH